MGARRKTVRKRQTEVIEEIMRKRNNPILRAARRKELAELLLEYLRSLESVDEEEGGRRRERRLANLAGFCRSLGCGPRAFEQFASEYPETADYLLAVFEDELIRENASPTLLAAYLKRRLGYGTEGKSDVESETDCGLMRLVFEHDVEEDGE